MAIGKIGRADAVNQDAPSSTRERTSQQREEMLNFAAPYKEVAKPPRNQKVEEVAKLYEKQFLGEMLKAMRGTVSESEFTKPSMAEKVYKDQVDERYVDQWGESGGIGLSDMIYDQIMQRYFGESGAQGSAAAAGSKGFDLKSQGAIKLSNRDVLKVSRLPEARPQQIPFKVELKPGDGTALQIHAPWSGTLLTQTRLPDGKNALVLDHGSGVRSTLIFEGVPSALTPGQKIEKGMTVGVLSPEINSFFWNLNQASKAL